MYRNIKLGAIHEESEYADSRESLAKSEPSNRDIFDIDFEFQKYERIHEIWPAGTSRLWKYIFGFLVVLCFDLIFQVIPMPLQVDVSRVGPDTGNRSTVVDACSCGKSIAEAKGMGCVYDELAIGWLPRQCRDEELTKEFHTAGPNNTEWPYFADRKATQPLTLEEVSLLSDTGEPFYTTHYWYLVHCNYNWRKLLRTLETGVIMDLRNNNEAHTKNCGDLGVKYRSLALDGISTRVYNTFGYV
ncbi:hypothetical protein F5884DRAFT_9742 [Xylogone sp. PMI_703]|nr:hypothetical protein F5884DRAFT_9742 [Xylogone sp. PMI_703]